MKSKKIHNEPSEVFAADGYVAIAGPDGSVVVLTPEAAEETSDRLWKGAMFARNQQRLSHPLHEPKKKVFQPWS